ncbi:MAG: ABC transporter permease [Acidobacteria bacterium]|nr:ABC transporter permease [Acidobacteriota bacterium]
MWTDLIQAGRQLLRRWPSSATIILLIGAGVACCSALFSVIDGLLFKPLPFPHQEQLVAVRAISSRTKAPVPMTSWQVRELQALGVLQVASYSRYANPGDRSRDTLQVAAVSPEFFDVLGVGAHIGRVLVPTDHAEAGIVMAFATWRDRYGSEPGALGKTTSWNGQTYTIVGVAPPAVDFPYGADAWVLSAPPSGRETGASLQVIGRLPSTASLRGAAAQLPQYALTSLREHLKPGGTFGLVLLLVATSLVLAVAWVQVAAMQVARAAERGRDTRIRLALGATRRHLLRFGAAEGVWLGAGALATAAALTPLTTQFIVGQLPPEMTRGQLILLDLRVAAFACSASVVGIVAFAVGPLWRSSRRESLREVSNRAAASRTRHALVVAQVAVAVPLVYLAGLAWLSSTKLIHQDLGFQPNGLYAVRLPRPAVIDSDASTRTLADLRAKFDGVAATSGVLDVAAGSEVPFGGRTTGALTLSGVPGGDELPVIINGVAPTYFSAMGIALLDGRPFLPTDAADTPLVAVVNATVASRLRQTGRDIGAHVLIIGRAATVVGVVGDTRDAIHPSVPAEPRVYLASDQWAPPGFMFVRLDPTDRAAESRLRAQVRQLWPDTASDLMSVAERVEAASTDFRGRSTLLALLALGAIAMTLLGIHGAVSAVTRDRTAEIAVRIICGADPVAIAARVVVSAVRWVALGVVVGLVLGWGAARATSSLLFGTGAFDPFMVAAVAGALLLAALAAAVVPARRAATLQPAVALREQ